MDNMKDKPFDPIGEAANLLRIEDSLRTLAKITKRLYDSYIWVGFTEEQARVMAQSQVEQMRKNATGGRE